MKEKHIIGNGISFIPIDIGCISILHSAFLRNGERLVLIKKT